MVVDFVFLLFLWYARRYTAVHGDMLGMKAAGMAGVTDWVGLHKKHSVAFANLEIPVCLSIQRT